MSSFISVIIPTYNRAQFIRRAIDSVLNQTYKNFELIIVDDGSTDETEDFLDPLKKAGLIRYLKRPNLGVSCARNFGVENATGTFISFLDSDDEWLPHKLQDQLNFLERHSSLRIVYGEELWIRNGKRVNQKKIHQKSGGWIFDQCVQQCLIAPSSVMMEKSLFLEMGGFDEQFMVCEDYDLWLKISSLFEIGFVSHPLIIKHGGHEDQLSTKFVAMDLWRLKSMQRILQIRNLNHDLKSIVVESMKRRGGILLLGFQKHGNARDYQVVEEILRSID